MKGRWKSNINVWFPFLYSQKWNWYFQNRIIMFCLPVPTLIYLWDISIFPGSAYLFCCRKICEPFLGIYKAHRHMRNWDCGRAIPRNGTHEWDLHCSVSPVSPTAKFLYRSIFLDDDILHCLLWVLSFYDSCLHCAVRIRNLREKEMSLSSIYFLCTARKYSHSSYLFEDPRGQVAINHQL